MGMGTQCRALVYTDGRDRPNKKVNKNEDFAKKKEVIKDEWHTGYTTDPKKCFGSKNQLATACVTA